MVTRGGGLWAIDRATLAERRIVEFAGAELGECSIDRDGEWLTAAFKRGAQCGLAVGALRRVGRGARFRSRGR